MVLPLARAPTETTEAEPPPPKGPEPEAVVVVVNPVVVDVEHEPAGGAPSNCPT